MHQLRRVLWRHRSDVRSTIINNNIATFTKAMEQRKRQKTESVGHDVIDLTAEEECEGVRNQEKRETDPSSLDFEFPVKLLKTRGIPQWANEGPLGFDLTQACSGAIQWALVSNFMIDMAWLASACPHLFFADQLIIVHGQKDNAPFLQSLERLGMAEEEYCVVSPDVPPYGTYHSKAFFLKYPTGMRVIIHTANLVYSDVNNKSQTAFVQDFPFKDAESPSSSDFEKEIVQYVTSLGLPARQLSQGIDLIKSIDFSSARAHLIASVPSKPFEYRDVDQTKYGHPRLKACLEKEPEFDKKFAGAPIVAQFSSIGNLSTNFLRGFTESLSSGRYGEQRHPLGAPAVAGNGNAALCPLELVWPSVEEIRDSLEGWFAGGSIPGYPDRIRKSFLMPRYHCWDGSKAGRQRAMPHMKTYLRYDAASTEIAWICITSHNLSKAAWGEQVQSKKYNRSLFRILSYELGVLIVPSLEMAYRNHRHAGFCCTNKETQRVVLSGQCRSVRFLPWSKENSDIVRSNEAIEIRIPLPFPIPCAPYASRESQSKETVCDDPSTYSSCPWDTRTKQEPWKGIDALGNTFPGNGSYYGVLHDQDWQALFCSDSTTRL